MLPCIAARTLAMIDSAASSVEPRASQRKIVDLFAPENLDKFGDHPPPPKIDPVFDGLGGLSGPVLKTGANLLG